MNETISELERRIAEADDTISRIAYELGVTRALTCGGADVDAIVNKYVEADLGLKRAEQ